jgi:Autophagocytosis associated protein, active-site domain
MLLVCAQILQDISEEHARKTATVETFPHLSIPAVGIHPCKHADVMKKLVGIYTQRTERDFLVDQCVSFGPQPFARPRLACHPPAMLFLTFAGLLWKQRR